LQRHRIKGKVVSLAKCTKKEALDAAYKDLFVSKDFRTEEDDKAATTTTTTNVEEKKTEASTSVTQEAPAAKEAKGFRKRTVSKGDKTNFPKKGDTVRVRYKGKLENGQVFDTNTGKGNKPLCFKVGEGKVIRGWDEALLEMSVGEKAELVIQPDWAYGKKGIEGKIPPNSVLIFEVELEGVS